MAHPDAAEWDAACEDELRTFQQMGVYEIVLQPKNCKVVGSKWVFCIKCGLDSEVQKYKACVVAQGFTQIEGLNYNETFAPVAKFASFCLILTLAAQLNLEIHQMDVKATYLNGKLKEEIFMEAPPGFDVLEGMVLRLIKAVYGTKQGGCIWYEDICRTLGEMGYMQATTDHAVFVHVWDDSFSIIVLYVDDTTLASTSLAAINEDKVFLKSRYQMTDLGELTWILGMQVTQDRDAGWIALTQHKYIEDMLEQYGLSNSCPSPTPVLANQHLSKLTSPEIDIKSYQCTIGALMYPSIGTRPDISYTITTLGHHATNPGLEHQHALDCVFCYLCVTSDYQLVYQRGVTGGDTLFSFMDADWASDINNWKSTSGFLCMLASGAMSWGSKKQGSVALSSTKAEYIAAAHAAKEVIWLRRLLSKLHQLLPSPTTLRIDNQSTIAIAKNPKFHDHTKHIEVCHHFLCQKVEQ
jgi:Reverse transcriptase (RNA-dependent DNA polymerase)